MSYAVNGYKFQRGSKKWECPDCKRISLTRFINAAGEYLPENVGRCDHEDSCRYNYTAWSYFEDNNIPIRQDGDIKLVGGDFTPEEIIQYYNIDELEIVEIRRLNCVEPEYHFKFSEIAPSMLKKNEYGKIVDDFPDDFTVTNYFIKYLIEVLGLTKDVIEENMKKYETYIRLSFGLEDDMLSIDSQTVIKSKPELMPDYKTIYEDNVVHTPINTQYARFIVKYVYKDVYGNIPTIRTLIYSSDFHRISSFADKDSGRLAHRDHDRGKRYAITGIQWCLYGEHLLRDTEDKNVIVVESEKTAFVLSMFYPEFIWVATGGLNNMSKDYQFLNNNPKYFFLPDAGLSTPYDKWCKRVPQTIFATSEYEVVDLNPFCTPEESKSGIDILDLYIKNKELCNKIINQLKK